MPVIRLLLVALLLSSCSHARQLTAVTVESLALGADMRTTDLAFHRGAVEGNPLLQRHRNVVMVGLSVPCAVVTWRECGRADGHCVLWTSLCSVPHAIVSIHNTGVNR